MTETMNVEAMAEVLGPWTRRDGPLYRRLADALGDAIDRGRPAAGTRLPPERDLAQRLAISRSTVAAAWGELERDGLLERRQGAGTSVRALPRPPDEGRRELIGELDDHALLHDLSGAPAASIEFVAAAVDCAPDVLTAAQSLDPRSLRRWTRGHGYVPLGIPPLREAVAGYLTDRGLPTRTSQVMVTTGAVEAVLLAGRLYLDAGDPVAVESPSYVGALDVLRSLGARLLGVGVDHAGTRPDHLGDLFGRALPRLAYLVPDFHNPTGTVLDAGRRQRIARLSAEFHVPVIEDLVQRELWLESPPPPPVAAMEPTATVLTLGSMSKVFWGGLRIGWVRADPATIERLGRIKTATNYGTPVLDQLVAATLLSQTEVVARRRRTDLAERLERLETALRRHLPDWRWQRPSGGLALWAQLPRPLASALTRTSQQHGVAAVPGTTFGVSTREHRDRVRLPFVAAPDVIDEGIRRLAIAWDRVAGPADPDPARALVV